MSVSRGGNDEIRTATFGYQIPAGTDPEMIGQLEASEDREIVALFIEAYPNALAGSVEVEVSFSSRDQLLGPANDDINDTRSGVVGLFYVTADGVMTDNYIDGLSRIWTEGNELIIHGRNNDTGDNTIRGAVYYREI